MRLERLRCLYRAALLVVALGTCSGCATAMNQYGYWHGGEQSNVSPLRDVWWVYGGAATDLLNFQRAEAGPLGTLSFYDLPLSTAADTILLPMTIVQQVVGIPGAQDEGADSYRRRFSTYVRRRSELRREIPLEGARGPAHPTNGGCILPRLKHEARGLASARMHNQKARRPPSEMTSKTRNPRPWQTWDPFQFWVSRSPKVLTGIVSSGTPTPTTRAYLLQVTSLHRWRGTRSRTLN